MKVIAAILLIAYLIIVGTCGNSSDPKEKT